MPAELEGRDAEYRNALASVESQQAAVAKIELTLRRFGLSDADIAKLRGQTGARYAGGSASATIPAPFSGVVTKYNVAEGEVILSGAELMESGCSATSMRRTLVWCGRARAPSLRRHPTPKR